MGTIQHSMSVPTGSSIGFPIENIAINSRFGVCSSSTLKVTGSETVVDGVFAAVTDWTATDCTIASVAGGKAANCLEITRTGADVQNARQTIILEIGELYNLKAFTKQGTSGVETANFRILDAADDSVIFASACTVQADWAANADMDTIFRAWKASVKVVVEKGTATPGTMLFDTVSIKKVVPAYEGADITAPDGFIKSTTMTIQKLSGLANMKSGAYPLLLTPSAANDNLQYLPLLTATDQIFISQFAGQDVAMAMEVKTSTATHARLELYDGITDVFSDYHTGGGGWEWLEVTLPFSASLTQALFKLRMTQTTGVVYCRRFIISFGKTIGGGNWKPPSNEKIILNAPQQSTKLGGTVAYTTSTGNVVDVAADSRGVIPVEAKEVWIRANVRDSGSAGAAAWLKFRHHSSSGEDWPVIFSCGGLANDLYLMGGAQPCPVQLGVIDLDTTASDTLTLDVNDMCYTAVQY